MTIQKIYSVFLFVILVIGVSLTSCSTSGDDYNGNNDSSEPSANEVQMVGQSFTPNSIEIEVGTTLTWVNKSSMTHTVTSGKNGQHDNKFDSGNIAPNAEFSYKFNDVGEFPYYCIPHLSNGMTGTVTVVDTRNAY